MLYAEFAAYKKESSPEEFYGSISENNFFVVLSTLEGLSQEQGEEVLRKLASDIAEQKIEHLADLDAYISDFCKSANLPAQFSLSCGFLLSNIILLKTIGGGIIYMRRNREVKRLLEKDSSASGYVESGDSLVFAVGSTSQENEQGHFEKALSKDSAVKASEELSIIVKDKEQSEKIALFVFFERKEPTLTQEEEHLVSDPLASAVAAQVATERISPVKEFIENVKAQLQGQDKKKKATMVVVVVVLVVFIWSVILGYQRRANASIDKKTEETKELVAEKLRQADDVAFLNLARATALINDAKVDVRDLKKELNGKKEKEVKTLEDLIAAKEEKILKKEDKQFEEFFDLSVEEKKATGIKMSLEGDVLATLDNQSGAVYLLSLSKKSLDRKSADEIKNGNMVANTEDKVFVFKPGRGIVVLDSDGKATEAIDNDPTWGSIVSMITYNNNLYLLDSQKGDIYKYIPAEKGFSEKSSYFNGQDKPNLTSANSLAIDLSVYAGFPDSIAKFTSGIKDGFNPTFPESGVRIDKIITNGDLKKVYAWDKKKSSLYVVNKDGVYERQINSSIFSKGDDVIVSGENAYILKGSKIYTVSVN